MSSDVRLVLFDENREIGEINALNHANPYSPKLLAYSFMVVGGKPERSGQPIQPAGYPGFSWQFSCRGVW